MKPEAKPASTYVQSPPVFRAFASATGERVRLAGRGTPVALALLSAAAAALPSGDPARGERVFQYCYACHAVEPGDTQGLQGPHLAGVVGRRIASLAGYEYSSALRALADRDGTWTEERLDRYLADPRAVASRTTMAFPGVRDAQERADLIAYLKTKRP